MREAESCLLWNLLLVVTHALNFRVVAKLGRICDQAKRMVSWSCLLFFHLKVAAPAFKLCLLQLVGGCIWFFCKVRTWIGQRRFGRWCFCFLFSMGCRWQLTYTRFSGNIYLSLTFDRIEFVLVLLKFSKIICSVTRCSSVVFLRLWQWTTTHWLQVLVEYICWESCRAQPIQI